MMITKPAGNDGLSIKETLKTRRTEISDFHYGKFSGEAYDAKGLAADLPKDAKERVRAVQSNLRGPRDGQMAVRRGQQDFG